MGRTYFAKRRKPRQPEKLTPEKLHEILCGIYPKEIADELFINLSKSETTEKGGGEE